MKKTLIQQNSMLKSSLYKTSIYSPFNWKNSFQEKKNASQKLRENACSVYIMVIVLSHHQGFLGEPFKIITNHRKWNKNEGKLFTHQPNWWTKIWNAKIMIDIKT